MAAKRRPSKSKAESKLQDKIPISKSAFIRANPSMRVELSNVELWPDLIDQLRVRGRVVELISRARSSCSEPL